MNKRYKIVLVDDNISTLNQGKTLLSPFYRVSTVQKAETLFENLQDDIPDLILLDVEMPEMNGFEVIKKLKADARYRDIPVMFLTGKSDEESERLGFSLGAVDYIAKPFSEPLLQKRVSNQILYMRVRDAVSSYSNDLDTMMGEVTKANERTRILLEKTPLCARLWNKDMELIDCNEAAIKLFGFKDKEELMEKNNELYPKYQPCGKDSLEKSKECIEQAFRDGVCEVEWMYQRQDGTLMPALVTMIRVEYEGEYAIAGYTRDLTEQRAMIEEMRRAEIAEESNKAKSRFLATMSHEMRTPMNSIIGFAELAIELPNDAGMEEAKVYLSKIKSSSEWLLGIINDILDISKIEANRIELETVPFDLQYIIMRCQSVVLPETVTKGLELKINTEPIQGRKFLGDPTRLFQVIINLLSNAVKFTKEGLIELTAKLKYLDNNKISVYFEVKDNGIGITEEQAKIIFDPFTQAETSITRNYGGTGLGLPISKNLIELMGGELFVDSTPGKGSRFYFELVFDTVQAETDLELEHEPEYDKPNFEGEVLVCEDNDLNQQVICENLTRIGLTYTVANNGKEGVDCVQKRLINNEKLFDLILMDIHMPVMNGLEAAAKITKMETGIPIIALTADLMSDGIKSYAVCGITGFIGKPFTSQDLWNGLKKYLPVKSYTLSNNKSQRDKEKKILEKLKENFAKSNKTIFSQITEIINMGDTKTAHRIAHTLKSNAGQIGEKNLMAAAKVVESQLVSGHCTPEAMKVLELELNIVLRKLEAVTIVKKCEEKLVLTDELKSILDKLESTLKEKNAFSLVLADELAAFPATEQLVEHIENFNFPQALKTLKTMKTEMGLI